MPDKTTEERKGEKGVFGLQFEDPGHHGGERIAAGT